MKMTAPLVLPPRRNPDATRTTRQIPSGHRPVAEEREGAIPLRVRWPLPRTVDDCCASAEIAPTAGDQNLVIR